MEPTAQTLIGVLPPYRDEWLLIHPNQQVHDIMVEVLDAHEQFRPYYEKIALYFDGDSVDEICDKLFRFCKKNLRYREENENEQSTAVPTGLLIRGYCDCKGYSGFCGGVLDALNRVAGKNIDWAYRFASYHALDSTPHHVFIIVNDGDEEIWVDPTPNAQVMSPVWMKDKKISGMPLLRNIAGFDDGQQSVGASLVVTPATDAAPNHLNFSGIEATLLRGMWPHWLGLSEYRDMGGDRDINEWAVADQINKLIAADGGKHLVDGNFVKWVYDNSLRSWNFYFPGGVEPDFDGGTWLNVYQKGTGQTGWPVLLVTPDKRLTIDHDVQLDDYRNAGIHILTAWAQSLINKFDPSPYPLRPRALKEFSQNYTGNPGNTNANLFTEARGTSFFADVGHSIEDAVNFVKDGVLKIVGFLPRNAFLALVGLNVFHMASDLAQSISQGHWDEISNLWKNLGGDPDKLHNTIEHGAGQPAIEDANQTTDAATITGTMGAVQIAAIIAAAAPIITAMLKFLNKDGKLNTAIQATEAALQKKFPNANFSFLNGALTQGGTPVTFVGDPDTPGMQTMPGNVDWMAVIVGAGVATVAYFAINKRGQKKRLFLPAAAGIGTYILYHRYRVAHTEIYTNPAPLPSVSTQQSDIQNLLTSVETGLAAFAEQQSVPLYDTATIDYNELNTTQGYDVV